MKPISLADAVLTLKPTFGTRLVIRDVLQELFREHSYFATIPRDICNIISDFVPDLRQTYTDKHFSDAASVYQEFVHKYNIKRDKTDPQRIAKLQHPEKFLLDFPGHENILYDILRVKCIREQVVVFDNIEYTRILYVGNNTRLMRNGIMDYWYADNLELTQFNKICQGKNINICILPCQLVMIQVAEFAGLANDFRKPEIYKNYVADLNCDHIIKISDNLIWCVNLIDDFGKIFPVSGEKLEDIIREDALFFSDMTSNPLYVYFG